MHAKDKLSEPKLPLTPAMFHVMLSLADGEKHGYAILKDVEQNSEGEVQLSTGTLYGIIKRLLSEGMIEEIRPKRPGSHDDARRRYYRLSEWGHTVAVAEAERMQKVLAMAQHKRLLRQFKPA